MTPETKKKIIEELLRAGVKAAADITKVSQKDIREFVNGLNHYSKEEVSDMIGRLEEAEEIIEDLKERRDYLEEKNPELAARLSFQANVNRSYQNVLVDLVKTNL